MTAVLVKDGIAAHGDAAGFEAGMRHYTDPALEMRTDHPIVLMVGFSMYSWAVVALVGWQLMRLRGRKLSASGKLSLFGAIYLFGGGILLYFGLTKLEDWATITLTLMWFATFAIGQFFAFRCPHCRWPLLLAKIGPRDHSNWYACRALPAVRKPRAGIERWRDLISGG